MSFGGFHEKLTEFHLENRLPFLRAAESLDAEVTGLVCLGF